MKALVRKLLLRGLIRSAREPEADSILALTYHSIDASGSPISFPEQRFRRQVEWLAASGYRSITASEAAQVLAGQREPAGPAVVVTFDDGFLSVRASALPILSECGFTATVFCVAGYVGKACEWERTPGIPAMEMMSWPDLLFLAGQGWEIGGHTVSHARLPGMSAAVMQEEIAEGRRILQDRMGCAVDSFAYPYGELDEGCAQAVAAAGFTSGWTMDPVINRPPCDPLTLGRFNCDRIQSEDPEAAELAVKTYASGRYGAYALLTARRLRIRRRPQRTR